MFAELDEQELLKLVQAGVGSTPIDGMTYEEAGEEMAAGVETSKFGLGFADSLWDSLKSEFHDLVCKEGGKYADLQAKFAAMGSQGTTAIVAPLSSGLAAGIGLSAVIIAPIVALLLLAVSRVGRQAYCSMRHVDQPIVAN